MWALILCVVVVVGFLLVAVVDWYARHPMFQDTEIENLNDDSSCFSDISHMS